MKAKRVLFDSNTDDFLRLEIDRYGKYDVYLGEPIVIIGYLELWDGKRTGYKLPRSANLGDCFLAGPDDLVNTWYLDEHDDLVCEAIHHDGTNHILYRTWKPRTTQDQRSNFLKKVASNQVTRRDITRYTCSLGPVVINALESYQRRRSG